MKNNLNKLLLISLLSLIVVTIICWCAIMFDDFNLFYITGKIFLEDPGVGVIFFPFTFLVDFGMAIFYLIMLFIFPFGTLLLVLVLQIFARLLQIGQSKKWKNIISKIFVYTSLVLQILLCVYLFLIFISTLNLIILLAIVVIIINIVLFIKEVKIINKLGTIN